MLDADLFNLSTPFREYQQDVWRVVESQEYAATAKVVDDLAEQDVLEQLLDAVKPKYRAGTQDMHYLFKTAFRYPPLRWGSRFGTRLMPSYFYASEERATALAECAYYRFLLMQDLVEPYTEPIRSEYCMFSAQVRGRACLDLLADGFSAIKAKISDPASYAYSQEVGDWAQQQGRVDIIRFESARVTNGINLALIEPTAIHSPKPITQQNWLCLTKSESVSFSSRESDLSYVFRLTEYCDTTGQFQRVG